MSSVASHQAGATRAARTIVKRCQGVHRTRPASFRSATTVRAALEELERSHPSLHRNICDETGAVRRHLNVFVNSDHMRDRQGLDTALAPGDVVTILAAVSGG